MLFGLKTELVVVKNDQLTLDVLADRPDLLSVEGISREVKGILGLQKGLAMYKVAPSSLKVTVEPAATEVRAFIACAAIRGISWDDEALRQAMQLQEKLHVTYCRKRRAASIGLYDLDTVDPRIRYTAMKPDEIRFRPLEKSNEMNGRAILTQTEQGREYGAILADFERYPMLIDDRGQVLSMPPIVNSEETKVTLNSHNVFIDVTGVSEGLVNQVVTILACNLAERGGKLESVQISYPERRVSTPNLTSKRMRLRSNYANASLGTRLSSEEIARHLGRVRFGVKSSSRGNLVVEVPAYRVDILGEIDVVEDLAIAYGYDHFKPILPGGYTIGSELPRTRAARLLREAFVGLGYQEILSFMMTNPRVQYELTGMEPARHVEVQNPMSQEYSTLRTSLLPNLLKFLGENKHVSLPHRVFECGDVVVIDETMETLVRSERRVAAAFADNEVGYEDIQAVVQAFLREFSVSFELVKSTHPSLLLGRTARVDVDEVAVGVLGEVKPEILINFGLDTPVAACELNIDVLTQSICSEK